MTNIYKTLAADAVAIALTPLRYYQKDLVIGADNAWASGAVNVLLVSPTGSGKTVTMGHIIAHTDGAVCAIAHRQELVSQISIALARNHIRHRIIGPLSLTRNIIRLHMEEFNASYIDPNAKCAVAGVDTLIRRDSQLSHWLPTVKLWVIDEAHHVIRDNKWGTACQMFPNARGLGVTATPTRADGYGVGSHADGVFDVMIQGPTMRDLIDQGFLTDYRIFAPPSTFHREEVPVSNTTGDFNLDKMRKAIASSSLVVHDEKQIVGDIVQHYIKIAKGKLGVTFVPDIITAEDVAKQYNDAGVPAEVVSSKTPDIERAHILRRFKNRELLQLVNVDLFGEGFDLPAIEVVSMGRPTESYGLYVQQFGRALRLLDGKDKAIIIDHVGNVARHGLPDAPREWSLDRRERRSSGKTDAIPVRTCLNPECVSVYERYLDACPYCGTPIPPPAERSGPEQVEGDLYELDPTVLEQLRKSVAKVDLSAQDYRDELVRQGVPQIGVMVNVKRHIARQETIGQLRETMAWWAGHQRAKGLSDSEIFKLFYMRHGIDWLSAQKMKRDDALSLMEKLTWKGRV